MAAYDGSNAIVGVNGNIEDASSVGRNSNGDLKIGRRSDDSTGFFDGSIDDPRVYNKAISDNEFTNLYNSGNING
jgi:hypothetical protein